MVVGNPYDIQAMANIVAQNYRLGFPTHKGNDAADRLEATACGAVPAGACAEER